MSFLLTVPIVACPIQSSGANPEDEAALLALHELALKTHIEGNIDLLLATQAENFVLMNSGEISTPIRNDRRKFLGRYLRSTKFTAYRDRFAPVVNISRDGMLGWVATQIEAWGVAMTPRGKRPVEFVVAWIELYERREGEWISVGSSSSFKPNSWDATSSNPIAHASF